MSAVDLVPGQHLVRGDVEGVPDRVDVPHQPDEALREVGVVRHGPQGRPVARDDDLLPLPHAVDERPGVVPACPPRRDLGDAVGEARPHDGDREALLPVLAHEQVLAGDLVAAVLPVRVGEGRGLGDEVVRRRVSGRRSPS